MTLDELLLEWSYRSERGYPSVDNPSDVSLLKLILEEEGLPTDDILDNIEKNKGKTYANKDGKVGKTTGLEDSEFEKDTSIDNEDDEEVKTSQDLKVNDDDDDKKEEGNGDATYDAIIRNHLGLDITQPIPRVENTYAWPGRGGSTFNIQVKGNDLKHWKDFWELAPPVAGKEIGTKSKGTGNGEVALYWLYQHGGAPGVNVEGTQGSDNPDLEFNKVGVEVKAFGKAHEKAKGLGRWSQDKDQLDALGILFGFQKLVSTLQPKSSGKLPPDISPNNFKGYQLKDAFDQLAKLKEVKLERLGEEYPIFLDIKGRLDSLTAKIGDWDPEDTEDAARRMAVYFISPKVGRKPGDGGFLTHVLENGDCRFWAFDVEKLKNHPDLIGRKGQSGYIGSASSQMYVEFDHLLG
jgi:hypothetical protein